MVKNQYLAGFCVNIITISYGGFVGWSSPSFLELQSSESPLESGPLSNEEVGWAGSMLCIGGALGTIFFSWCADRIGRKRSLLFVALPALLGWVLVPYAQNLLHLCISRMLGGFAGGGSFTLIPLYTLELSEDRVRGSIGSLLVLSCNAGILIAYTLGTFFTYSTVAWIFSISPILFLLSFSFLPETPQHFTSINKMKHAEKSLKYYRNVRTFSKEIEVSSELENLRAENEKKLLENSEMVILKLFNDAKACKAFFIGIGLIVLMQFCGVFGMMNYTASIFSETGLSIEPNVGVIIVGVILLIGSYVSTILVERTGRKFLLIASAIGVCLGHVAFGVYAYLNSAGYEMKAFSWVPVASFSLSIFFSCWGLVSLPYVVISEILPTALRNTCNMLCMLSMWVMGFFLLKYLPVLVNVVGMHGLVFIFAGSCLVGLVFLIVCLPETKGKDIDTILSLL